MALPCLQAVSGSLLPKEKVQMPRPALETFTFGLQPSGGQIFPTLAFEPSQLLAM